jgi:hypothetical protein
VDDWGENADGSYTTSLPVQGEHEYIYAPIDNNLKITFHQLPGTAGQLTEKKIILTPDQQTQMGATTSTAYEITSPMGNGSFDYDLTLPLPNTTLNPGEQFVLKSAPDLTRLSEASPVFGVNTAASNDTTGTVADVQVVDNATHTIRAGHVNHFTIFAVSTITSGVGVGGVATSLANGFPSWYQDSVGIGGLRLRPCDGANLDGTGIMSPVCNALGGLLSPLILSTIIDPNASAIDCKANPLTVGCGQVFDPTLPITARPWTWLSPGPTASNMPGESFYYLAKQVGAFPNGKKYTLSFVLEGTFAGPTAPSTANVDPLPVDGHQIVFPRIILQLVNPLGLTPNSTYTVHHPYGTMTFTTDASGNFTGKGNRQVIQDGGLINLDFTSFVGIPLATNIGPFLRWDTGAPVGYIGDGVTTHAVTGSPTGFNSVTITGPGVNQTDSLFIVGGKLSASQLTFATQPSITAVSGTPLAIQPIVDLKDGMGNIVADAIDPVTMAAFTDAACTIAAPAGTLSGTTTVNGVAGVATFTNVSFTLGSSGTFFLGATNPTMPTQCAAAATVVTNPAPVLTSVTVAPLTANVNVGATTPLVASPLDQFGLAFVGSAVAWTSSNAAVASVNSASGVVTGVTAGTATITATAVSGAISKTGTSAITVIVPTVTGSIVLNAGWNLVTLPVQPVDAVTGLPISETAETFAVLAGADIVSQWSGATQSFLSHTLGSPFNAFSVTNGMGLFVHSLTSKVITVTGTAIPQTTPATVVGWNAIGWSGVTATTAGSYMSTIVGADIVSQWNNTTQSFLSHTLGSPFNNFVVNQGDGMFVHQP